MRGTRVKKLRKQAVVEFMFLRQEGKIKSNDPTAWNRFFRLIKKLYTRRELRMA